MSAKPVVVTINFEKALEMPKEQIRALISELEEQIKDAPQLEIPEKNYFSHGVYGREITIPAGTLIVGKIHKYAVMNVISKGDVSILSVDGVVRVKAPYTYVSSPGAKRVIYAHEESVWSNFLGTTETDTDKIESEFIAKSYDEVEALKSADVLEIKGA
jgi:hypothetical protein